ncbi:MAG TPA: carbohydrate kinase family protein, partial [Patescibacteria group bacterium]
MSKATFDLISIGDSTLDTFVKLDEASVLCDFNHDHCWLCLSYADKIPIERLDHTTGGNSSNMAVGSARLGLKSAFFTVLGDDDVADKILASLKHDKVDCRYVQRVKKTTTNFSVVLNYQTERTILVYHEKRKYQLPKLQSAKWVYYSSMGKGFQSIHKDLLRYIKKTGARVGFNPGTFQLNAGNRVLANILEMTEVLFVNREEAQRLLGNFKKSTIKELLRGLRHLGPRTPVITDGPKGAYSFDGKTYYYMPIYDIKVVERTGAGDSFSTGFLTAIIKGKSP